jgi:hypothetical protein
MKAQAHSIGYWYWHEIPCFDIILSLLTLPPRGTISKLHANVIDDKNAARGWGGLYEKQTIHFFELRSRQYGRIVNSSVLVKRTSSDPYYSVPDPTIVETLTARSDY